MEVLTARAGPTRLPSIASAPKWPSHPRASGSLYSTASLPPIRSRLRFMMASPLSFGSDPRLGHNNNNNNNNNHNNHNNNNNHHHHNNNNNNNNNHKNNTNNNNNNNNSP